MVNDKKKYFSMFTGVGGFEKGINNKATCIGFSEIDKYANQVLKYHFPKIKNYGDATKIDPEKIPNFDILCAGFPCQAFSTAGKRKGFQDTRGTLFFDIARILKVKRPSLILLENVKGLLNHDNGKTFTKIIQTLDELGYEIEWVVLNSKFFGAPQNRERILIIGHNRKKTFKRILPIITKFRIYEEKQKFPPIPQIYRENFRKKRIQKGYEDKFGQPRNAITRRLSPIEAERLQGFPDDWTKYGINENGEKVEISKTQRFMMMGNAITINVVKDLSDKIFNFNV